jgi:cytidine deaminase
VYDEKEFAVPCGICLQVLAEFGPELTVIMANTAGEYKRSTLCDLLPNSFDKRIVG